MERSEGLDFDIVKGVRKPRTFATRKPRTLTSHAFIADYDCNPLSSSTSPPSDLVPAHNGSSSQNMTWLSNDEDEYDQEVSRKEGDSPSERFRCDISARTEEFKAARGWDDGNLNNNFTSKSSRDVDVPGDFNSTRLGWNQDTDSRSAVDSKYHGGKIIRGDASKGGSLGSQGPNAYAFGDKYEMDPERSGGTSKRKYDVNHLETQRAGSFRRVPFKGQRKPNSDLRSSEGVMASAKTLERTMERHLERSQRFSGSTGGQHLDQSEDTNELKTTSSIKGLQKMHHMGDPSSEENRPTKVKLKLKGVTHSISASHNENPRGTKHRVAIGTSASKHHSPPSDVRRQQKLILQENTDDEYDYPRTAKKQRISLSKSRVDRHSTREDAGSKTSNETVSQKSTNNAVVEVSALQAVRKSRRVPKRRLLDGEHGNDDDDEDVISDHKGRASKRTFADDTYGEDCEVDAGHRRSSRIPKKRVLEGGCDDKDTDYIANRRNKRGKKKGLLERTSENLSKDDDESAVSTNEDGGNSDLEVDVKSQKSRRGEVVGLSVNDKSEAPLTARQRALQSIKEDPETGAKLFEFPDALPQAGQKKQKEKISDLEQQLKKAEAAQRRRMQVEKAAKEMQAEAIRKILGHDSNKGTRAYKLRRKQNEMAQQKAATSMVLGSNTVRWVMGPTGTIVSFSEDAEFPSIFNSTSCRYPLPREKCAGPLCTNTYKYRDSKSNLPLCSLQCYRAINGRTLPVTTC